MNGQQAAEAAGVTYRQLDHWSGRGYLDTETSETPRRSRGSGRERTYGSVDVDRLRVMGELTRSLGMSPAVAARVAEAVVVRGRSGVTAGRWVLTRRPEEDES